MSQVRSLQVARATIALLTLFWSIPVHAALSFQQVVKLASERNPRMLRADAAVERARARLQQSRATWLPTLNGVGNFTGLDNPRVIGDRVVQAQTALNLSLVLSVPIIVPARWLDTSRQSALDDAARWSAQDASRLLALDAGRAFLSLRVEHAALTIAERAQETSRQQLDIVRKRTEEGVSSRLEEARAERELRDNEGRVALRKSTLATAHESLLAIIGEKAEAAFAVDEPIQLPDAPKAITTLENVQQRLDLKAARERLRIMQRAVSESWLDYLPFLTGQAQAFYQNPPTVSLPQTGWQAQLLLTVPIFDGGRRYGDRHERVALALEAEADVRDSELRAQAELRSLSVEASSREVAFEKAKVSAALAEESLVLARKVFSEGLGTQVDLIEAERSARDAATNAIVAENALLAARFALQLATQVDAP